ncbi:non-ribosomal peptide synthetase [Flavobacteriaceae bacterium M23B6Z8]
MESTLHDIFFENIKKDSTTGITFINGRNSAEHLSYKKLYLEACYKLHALQEKGIKRGDELVFQFESQKNFLVTFWACVFGKIVPVPLSYVSASDTITKICSVWEKLNNPYVISDNPSLKNDFEGFKDQNSLFVEIAENCLDFNNLALSKRAKPLKTEPSELVFIQFSSGSTGTPKGVTNTQEAILYNINNYLKHLQINESDRFLAWLPLTHDMGIIFFHLLPLLINKPQFLMPPSLFLAYPDMWLECLSEHEITMTGSPNFGFKLVLGSLDRISLERLSLKKLRYIMNGAEPVSVELCRKFTRTFEPCGLASDCIKPSYGLAEAVLGVSIRYYHDKDTPAEYFLDRAQLNVGDKVQISAQDSDNAASFANVGEFAGTEVRIVDENNNPLEEGTLGFISLKSPAVTKGYYNDPELTQKTIKDSWLNTGDIGFIKQEDLIITGRAKEMIVINGKNYFPNDLDRLIEELPEIHFQQALTCNVYNDEAKTDEVFVFVLFKGDVDEFISLSKRIKKHVGNKVGVAISRIIAVDKIHKSTSGKPQRYLMRENFLKGFYNVFLEKVEARKTHLKSELKKLTMPQIELKLIDIIQEITELNNIKATTNFFDLGITSIQTVRIKLAIEDHFLTKVDDVIMYKYTNTRDLAQYIASDILEIESKSETKMSSLNLSSAKSRMGKLLKSSMAE